MVTRKTHEKGIKPRVAMSPPIHYNLGVKAFEYKYYIFSIWMKDSWIYLSMTMKVYVNSIGIFSSLWSCLRATIYNSRAGGVSLKQPPKNEELVTRILDSTSGSSYWLCELVFLLFRHVKSDAWAHFSLDLVSLILGTDFLDFSWDILPSTAVLLSSPGSC